MYAHYDHFPLGHARPKTTGRTITWAWGYDALVRLLMLGQDRALRATTVRLAGLQAGESVLDVGCGTGSLTLLAKRQVEASGVVHGIDAAPEMVAVAQRKAAHAAQEVDFRVGVIEALPFSDDSFDAVLSSLMFHHLPDDLQVRGLAEIYRVLKPSGRLLVVDMKRPAGLAGHLQMALMFHGALGQGVQDLPRLMTASGYMKIEAGDLLGGPLGYVRGQTAL